MTTAEIQRHLHKAAWHMQKALVPDARMVFDVGAWRGDRSRAYRRLYPEAHICAFEPSPDTYGELVGRCADDPRIRPFPYAAGSIGGEEMLYRNGKPDTDSLLRLSPEFLATGRIAPRDAVPVQVVRLDTFCQERGIQRVDVLKLDVQGQELDALKGAQRLFTGQAVGLVYAEINFWRYYEDQCWWYEVGAWLARFGFELVALAPEWWDGRVKFADGLFARG